MMAIAAAVSGCNRSRQSTKGKLADSAVVLSVNGLNVTKGEFNSHCALMTALYQNRHPSANLEKIAKAKEKIRRSAKSETISRLMMYSNLCAGTNATEVSEGVRASVEAEYVKTFCPKGQSFDQLNQVLAGKKLEDVFIREFSRDVQVRAALEAKYPEVYVVADEDLSNVVRKVERYNETAAATNALICATMTNVLNRIRAGEDFAKLADEFSQDAEKGEGGDMGECDAETFGGDKSDYVAVVSALKPGEVSGILETDEGYEIVRKVADVSASESNSEISCWRLSRIFFHRPCFLPVLDDAAMRIDILRERRRALMEKLSAEFAKTAKVSVPHPEFFQKLGTPQKGKTKQNKEKK